MNTVTGLFSHNKNFGCKFKLQLKIPLTIGPSSVPKTHGLTESLSKNSTVPARPDRLTYFYLFIIYLSVTGLSSSLVVSVSLSVTLNASQLISQQQTVTLVSRYCLSFSRCDIILFFTTDEPSRNASWQRSWPFRLTVTDPGDPDCQPGRVRDHLLTPACKPPWQAWHTLPARTKHINV